MDTNEEERAKGKTVEVGRAHFETDFKRYTILDAPGHKNYVPNMIAGACQVGTASPPHSHPLSPSSSITSSLFKACAKSAGGLPAALAILREAETEHRMTAEVRTCSLVTLLALCEAEGAMDVTMELVDMIREEDRTPEVLAALSSFFSCGIHG